MKITVSHIIDDKEMKTLEGQYFNEDFFDTIITQDCDCFKDDGTILFKFRKNRISKELCQIAKNSYTKYSKTKHSNRGVSAGMLDKNKLPSYVGKFVECGTFRTGYISNTSGLKSKQKITNLAQSNIAGYFDKPDRNIIGTKEQCRETAFNIKYPELWEQSLPFLKRCDQLFQELMPLRHYRQYLRSDLSPNFKIPNTSFSTITLNYSWRTAAHQDAGDYKDGFGNLVILEDEKSPNTYQGCYLAFPQYGIAVDVREGDFLTMDVHEYHCNTEFKPTHDRVEGKFKNRDIINHWYLNRMSVVLYLRENMNICENDR